MIFLIIGFILIGFVGLSIIGHLDDRPAKPESVVQAALRRVIGEECFEINRCCAKCMWELVNFTNRKNVESIGVYYFVVCGKSRSFFALSRQIALTHVYKMEAKQLLKEELENKEPPYKEF